ncbi:uncharacterized protein [Littorina saxatilis]|uniref:Deoxyribonuclease TATDN1 n=1 Tax=Littorina saxatilis TaxID=31220 RepID=A0AAN9G3F9_9CAEN
MASSFREVLCIENVGKATPKVLAEHLVHGTEFSWRRLEVVFLYRALKSKHPLYAAVSVPRALKAACLAKNNSTFTGSKLKVLEWYAGGQKLRSARWILTSTGSRVSVIGTNHWATDLAVETDSSETTETEEDGVVECGFYDWSKIKVEGGEQFCYAAIDCGTGIQENVETKETVHCLLKKAVEAGVQRLVLKGSSIKNAEKAKALVARHPDFLGFSVGYHPDLTEAWKAEKLETMEELSKHPACVAIGECGLDLVRDKTNIEEQVKLFKIQVELACRIKKPLLVMERGAQSRVLDLLKDYQGRLPPVAIRSETPEKCDFNLYVQEGFYIVVTGRMFRQLSYNHSLFFLWLRSAKPWQRDYLLVASNAYNTEDNPLFVEKISQQDVERVAQHVTKSNYSDKAMHWFNESKSHKSKTTPLIIPVLAELLADGLGIPSVEFARVCLENSKRFFQVVKKAEAQKKEEVVREKGWEQTMFWLPLSVSLAAAYGSVRFVGQYFMTLHDWFGNFTETAIEM